jgi:hypothetical protein
MKRFGLAFLLFLLVSAPALLAQDLAPDTQTGNFLYRFPTGWNPVEKGDTTIINAPAPPPGTVTFIALAANDLEGDLQNSFTVLIGGLKGSYRIVQGGQPAPLRFKNRYDAFQTTLVAVDKNRVAWNMYILAVQFRKRLQSVIFMSNLPAGSNLTAAFNVFQNTFLASLSFGDALPGSQVSPLAPKENAVLGSQPAPAVSDEPPHSLPPGALEGIYMGYEIHGGHAGLKRLHFNSDGWVVKDILQEGMIGFDFTAYRNRPDTNRSWVGRYRVDGDQIIILWQDYTDDRQVIKRNETSPKPGIDVYVPMCRCTGLKFSGKYNFGLANSAQYIQFMPDGTFLDRGVLDQMLVPNPYFEHPRTQRGTYTIQSQTVIFTFADGRRGMRTFYAPKAQQPARLFDFIGLGWHILYEDHYQNEP